VSRFRTSKARQLPMLSTASLPDMIFTFLFFFMMVSSMRTVPTLTQVELPTASELQSLRERKLLVYVMAAPDQPLQVNSEQIRLDEMPAKLAALRDAVAPEDRGEMLAVLKLDKNLPMGLVDDIKQYLREAQVLRLYHSAEKSAL
jgi:biopolymer transport protein ExbD